MIKFIKRIWKYDNQDWKHIGWLLKDAAKQTLKGDLSEAKDAMYFVKLHLLHDSKRVSK